MIELIETSEGTLLPVTAQPGARSDRLVGIHDGRLKVAVTAPADKGRANAQIIRVLAAALAVKRSQIILRRGHASRQKIFLICGVPVVAVRARLALLGQGGAAD